jgi:hypothetical protein
VFLKDIQSVLEYFVAENFSEAIMEGHPCSDCGFEAPESLVFTPNLASTATFPFDSNAFNSNLSKSTKIEYYLIRSS